MKFDLQIDYFNNFFSQPLNHQEQKNIELLTQNKPEEIQKLIKIIRCSRGMVGLAINRYRNILYEEGVRGQVQLNEIIESYKSKNYILLRELLSELFLQYICELELDLFITKVDNNDFTINYIYNKHKQDPTKRFFRVVSTS